MRNFLIVRDAAGYRAGEVVSDIRLPRADMPALLNAGDIQEIDSALLVTVPVLDTIRRNGTAIAPAREPLSAQDQTVVNLINALLPDAMKSHEYFEAKPAVTAQLPAVPTEPRPGSVPVSAPAAAGAVPPAVPASTEGKGG